MDKTVHHQHPPRHPKRRAHHSLFGSQQLQGNHRKQIATHSRADHRILCQGKGQGPLLLSTGWLCFERDPAFCFEDQLFWGYSSSAHGLHAATPPPAQETLRPRPTATNQSERLRTGDAKMHGRPSSAVEQAQLLALAFRSQRHQSQFEIDLGFV